MNKVSVNLMIFLLISVLIISGTALSATIPDNNETAEELYTVRERNSLQYYLVTLPTTNKKRVDAMCLKFLSVIPKAILVPKVSESNVYRLITDTFDTLESAKKRKAELRYCCESPFVLKNDHGYSVIAGSQLTETLAVAEQKRLAGKNISTTILELRLPLKEWQMRNAESFDIREAVIMASKLAEIGVMTTIEATAD